MMHHNLSHYHFTLKGLSELNELLGTTNEKEFHYTYYPYTNMTYAMNGSALMI